ncbi:hypothetical protein XENOCAPTIV_019507, partial [Xenoophorus captivus]
LSTFRRVPCVSIHLRQVPVMFEILPQDAFWKQQIVVMTVLLQGSPDTMQNGRIAEKRSLDVSSLFLHLSMFVSPRNKALRTTSTAGITPGCCRL